MRVTLIYPQSGRKNNFPPLGVMYIGAVLEEAGHSVQIIDPMPKDMSFVQMVRDFDPQIVGVSIMTASYSTAADLLKKLKQNIPDTLYCAGGAHVTALPVETINDLELDFAVVGEGEFTMREVCKRIENGGDLHGVKGIVYRSGSVVVNNDPRDLIQNLDDLPFLGRHLLSDFKEYLLPPGTLRGGFFQRSTTMMTSRGCPYHCIYCSSYLIFGRKLRRRSVSNVIAEIEGLIKKYDIEALYFLDDTFTLNSRWVMEFCRQLREKKIPISWQCQARVDTVSEDLLYAMKNAGCISVEFGVESGSEKVLKIMKRRTSKEMIFKAFKTAKKAGLRSSAFFMLGNPGETLEDINQTFKVAKKIKANRTNFYFTVPFPGTELYQMAQQNSWLDKNLNFMELWDFSLTEKPLMEINFTKEELAKIRKKFRNHFILRNHLLGHINYQGIYRALLVLLKKPLESLKNFLPFALKRQWTRFIEYLGEEYRTELRRKPK